MSWKGDQKIGGLKQRFLEVVNDLVINLVGGTRKMAGIKETGIETFRCVGSLNWILYVHIKMTKNNDGRAC